MKFRKKVSLTREVHIALNFELHGKRQIKVKSTKLIFNVVFIFGSNLNNGAFFERL